MADITFVPVEVKFITYKNGPVSFVTVGFGFQKTFTLKGSFVVLLDVAETGNWLDETTVAG